MEYFIIFMFGIVMGSFLNVCIHRIPLKISLVRPGSFCPKCGAHVPFYFNVPLLGYLWLHGRCHSCQQPISFRYFAVELLAGLLTAMTYLKFGLGPAFFFYTGLIYFLIVISFIDFAVKLIYNRLLVYLLLFGIGFNLIFGVKPWLEAAAGFLAGGFSLLFFAYLGQFLFRKESMGMGDVKLAAVLGFFLGWKMILLALFFGFIYAMLAIILLSAAGKGRLGKYLPMAPFFTIGSVTFVYWGSAMIQWYWNYFAPVVR